MSDAINAFMSRLVDEYHRMHDATEAERRQPTPLPAGCGAWVSRPDALYAELRPREGRSEAERLLLAARAAIRDPILAPIIADRLDALWAAHEKMLAAALSGDGYAVALCDWGTAAKAFGGYLDTVRARPLSQLVPSANCESERIKGKPGRKGFDQRVLRFALDLRRNTELTSDQIRTRCKSKFPKADLPGIGDPFRAWLNRKRKSGRKRTN